MGDVPREEPDRDPDRGSLGQEWPGPSLSPDPSPRTMPATARGQQTRSENNLVSSETTFDLRREALASVAPWRHRVDGPGNSRYPKLPHKAFFVSGGSMTLNTDSQ